ncbi:MAG: sugar-phosphatase [Lactococcus sp.]|jgi:Cof subfamily protein (haloacid dehalogenase superfamily)
MGIKLVTIDVDGTLLNSQRQITQEVKTAISQAKAQGVKIVVTTGRPYLGVVDLLRELSLTDPGDYVITYNGGMILAADTGAELKRTTLTYQDYLRIDDLATTLGSASHAVTSDRLFTGNRDVSPYTVEESFIAKVPMSFRTREEMAAEKAIIKMMLVGEADALDQTIRQIPPDIKTAYTTVSSSPNFFEILNKKASKGQGLTQLAKILDIPLAETMAIGDAENDLSMLEAAGLAIAMGNAVPELLAIADDQTTTNDEHGVAVALAKFVLTAD